MSKSESSIVEDEDCSKEWLDRVSSDTVHLPPQRMTKLRGKPRSCPARMPPASGRTRSNFTRLFSTLARRGHSRPPHEVKRFAIASR